MGYLILILTLSFYPEQTFILFYRVITDKGGIKLQKNSLRKVLVYSGNVIDYCILRITNTLECGGFDE